ncbi:MAG: hypothetical protein DCO95_02305 [Roseivirga sp. XM-24bin3]|nr:MAG: hypothetical protein DCO95_02305 [Roseivirga sp. XM-24bin3]
MILKDAQSPFQETLSEVLCAVKPLYIETGFFLSHLFKAASLDQPLFHPEESRDRPSLIYCTCSDVIWVLENTQAALSIKSKRDASTRARANKFNLGTFHWSDHSKWSDQLIPAPSESHAVDSDDALRCSESLSGDV